MSGAPSKRPASSGHSGQPSAKKPSRAAIPILAKQVQALVKDQPLALVTFIEVYCHYSKHGNGMLPAFPVGQNRLAVDDTNFDLHKIELALQRMIPIQEVVKIVQGAPAPAEVYHNMFAEIYRIHGKAVLAV